MELNGARTYCPEWDSITRAFPPGARPPVLLADFAQWLKGRPWGGMGCFDLAGSFSDDAPLVDGTPLRRDLALFIRLPDGSVAGYWYAAGHAPANTPVVGLGSEGQALVLAASLESFLARIALKWFAGNGPWCDFLPHEDEEDATPLLAGWLEQRLGVSSLHDLATANHPVPDFSALIARHNAEREAYWRSHPRMAQLADALRDRYPPAGAQAWERVHFEAKIVGGHFELLVLDRGRKLVPDSAQAETILRALREEQLRDAPDFGLWTAMWFSVDAQGVVLPEFSYMAHPTIGNAPASREEALRDLARAPRPQNWIPRWITDGN